MKAHGRAQARAQVAKLLAGSEGEVAGNPLARLCRSQEWARRQPEAAAKPPAGSAPDFEQWMADSRQQHLAEAGSLGVQGSSSDFLAAAQALQVLHCASTVPPTLSSCCGRAQGVEMSVPWTDLLISSSCLWYHLDAARCDGSCVEAAAACSPGRTINQLLIQFKSLHMIQGLVL